MVNKLCERYGHDKPLGSSSVNPSTDVDTSNTSQQLQDSNAEQTPSVAVERVDSNNSLLLHLYALNATGHTYSSVGDLCDATDYSIASLRQLPYNQYLCVMTHLFSTGCTLLSHVGAADDSDKTSKQQRIIITQHDITSLLNVCGNSVP